MTRATTTTTPRTPPRATTRATKAGQDERLAQMCKALAHPVRIRILRLLLQKQGCLCGDLVGALPLAQSTISQHLKVLKEAGLVVGEIDGPRRCYCAPREALETFRELVGTL